MKNSDKIEKKYLKTSFVPISNKETRILILGSMPGEKSLEINEYYGHPRNRFWKIMSTIINEEFSSEYSEKKRLLLKHRIGLWDIVHKAYRKGSLDSAIKNEVPNDLDSFIKAHKNLKIIAFNGTKAEVLYDKYFDRKTQLRYLRLPSSSPANSRVNLENISKIWKELLTESYKAKNSL